MYSLCCPTDMGSFKFNFNEKRSQCKEETEDIFLICVAVGDSDEDSDEKSNEESSSDDESGTDEF